MVSRTPGVSWMFWSLIQRETNSSTWTVVVILPLSDRIQLLFRSSCWTDLFFLLIRSNKCGANYLGISPYSQLLCQKRAFAPSLTVILVDRLKSSRLVSLQGRSVPAQGLDSSTQSCQSHRKRRALPKFSKSGIPKPPRSLGLVTVGQFTRQWPPCAFSSPFHKNDLLILSIFFLAQVARGNTVRW